MDNRPNPGEKPAVLVADDDDGHLEMAARAVQRAGCAVVRASDGARALEILAQRTVDAVITDLQMPGADGIAVLRAASAQTPPVPTLIVTGFGTVETAVEAMKLGAVDYLPKPADLSDLQICLHRALERRKMLIGAGQDADEGRTSFGGLLGASAAMHDVFDQIRRCAPFKATVLITGETGTGKELVAQAIHALSACSDGPFLTMNCSAIPRELVESQLFGHKKGAFTGAVSDHRGFFEAADGGTLFLDEIGDLALEAQAKLLRVLEDRQVQRVGSTGLISVDVRVLAATNVDLRDAVQERTFREDLYYRVNVLTISLPPLRERREDIPLLVRTFLDRFARENSVPPRDMAPDVYAHLQAHTWPGNVRELKNLAERLAVMSRSDTIQIEDLPPELRSGSPSGEMETGTDSLAGMSLEEIERTVIQRTLEQTGGDRRRCAELLGISLRTLQRKLKAYGRAGDSDTSEM